MKRTATVKRFTDQPILLGVFVVRQLRAAGIPVLGSLWPAGVENGVLSMRVDGNDIVYEWEGEEMEQLF
jgi:hypothetical protein